MALLPQEIGATFAPTQEQADRARVGRRDPIMEAIQILSMRLPQVLGARPVAARALLERGFAGPRFEPGFAGPRRSRAPISVDAIVEEIVGTVLNGRHRDGGGRPGVGIQVMNPFDRLQRGA